MSQKEKLLRKLLSLPKDFSFEEMISLLCYFGYNLSNAGKTSGSAVKFVDEDGNIIKLHRPHPDSNLKRYALEFVLEKLKEGGHIQ